MAINVDGTKFDTVTEFYEFMDEGSKRGLISAESMDIGKYSEYLAEEREEYPEPEKKFKVGDKVKVVGNSTLHDFSIGEVRTVEKLGSSSNRINLGHPFNGWAEPEDVEKVEPLGQDANGADLYEGDIVTGIEGNRYYCTTSKQLMEIVCEEPDTPDFFPSNIVVKVTRNPNEDTEIGETFGVDSREFVKTTEEEFDAKKAESDEPSRPFKKGDKVIALEGSLDVTEGETYEVVKTYERASYIRIIDDAGEGNSLTSSMFRIADEPPHKYEVGDVVYIYKDTCRHNRDGQTLQVSSIEGAEESGRLMYRMGGMYVPEEDIAGRVVQEAPSNSRNFKPGDVVYISEEFTDGTGDTAYEGLAEFDELTFSGEVVMQGEDIITIEGNADKLTIVCRAEDRLDI